MTGFALTADQLDLRDAARAFAAQNLGADLVARDAAGAAGTDLWRADWQAVAAFGALRAQNTPEEGGDGRNALSTVALLEGLGQGMRDNALLLNIAAQLFVIQDPIRSFGTPTNGPDICPRWAMATASGPMR